MKISDSTYTKLPLILGIKIERIALDFGGKNKFFKDLKYQWYKVTLNFGGENRKK